MDTPTKNTANQGEQLERRHSSEKPILEKMPQRIADSSPPEEEVKSISPEVEPVQQEAQPVATKQDDDIASQTTVETAISEETKVSFLRVTV